MVVGNGPMSVEAVTRYYTEEEKDLLKEQVAEIQKGFEVAEILWDETVPQQPGEVLETEE